MPTKDEVVVETSTLDYVIMGLKVRCTIRKDSHDNKASKIIGHF